MNNEVRFSLLTFLALTVLDIAVLNICFYSGVISWHLIPLYHNLFGAVLMATPAILCLRHNSSVPLFLYPLFLLGVEDTLFYLLQFKLPSKYSGVWIAGVYEPHLPQVVMLNMLGVALATLIAWVSIHWRIQIQFHVTKVQER
mgnify:CR=1 FL=1